MWVARFAAPPPDASNSLSLTLGSGDDALSVDAEQLKGFMTDPAAFLRHELSSLEPGRRAQALRMLWSAAAPSLDRGRSFLLARLLANVHAELRPALPPMITTPDEPNVAHIDVAFEVNPRALWVKGWMHDRDGMAKRLTMVAPEGGRAELMPGLYRHRRADIDEFYGDKHGLRGAPPRVHPLRRARRAELHLQRLAAGARDDERLGRPEGDHGHQPRPREGARGHPPEPARGTPRRRGADPRPRASCDRGHPGEPARGRRDRNGRAVRYTAAVSVGLGDRAALQPDRIPRIPDGPLGERPADAG